MRLGRPVSLYPPVCFPLAPVLRLLQRKTIKKRMSKRCTFYVLIIPALCLSICYRLTHTVKRWRRRRWGAQQRKTNKETVVSPVYGLRRFGQVKVHGFHLKTMPWSHHFPLKFCTALCRPSFHIASLQIHLKFMVVMWSNVGNIKGYH